MRFVCFLILNRFSLGGPRLLLSFLIVWRARPGLKNVIKKAIYTGRFTVRFLERVSFRGNFGRADGAEGWSRFGMMRFQNWDLTDGARHHRNRALITHNWIRADRARKECLDMTRGNTEFTR